MRKAGKMVRKKSRSKKSPTKQGEKHKREEYEVGNKKPPKNRQFGQPEGNKRSDGRWKKEDSISYQYNYLIRLTKAELTEFSRKDDLTVAQRIAVGRVLDAMGSGTGIALSNTAEITNRTEGRATQSISMEVEQVQSNPFAELTVDQLRKLADG